MTLPTSVQRAHTQGFFAFEDGQPFGANPFPVATRDASEWHRCWLDAEDAYKPPGNSTLSNASSSDQTD